MFSAILNYLTLGFLKFLTQKKKKGECWINEKYISKNILHLIKIVYQVICVTC